MIRKILILLIGITLLSGIVKAEELEQKASVSALELANFLDDFPKYKLWIDKKGLSEQAGFNENLTEAYSYNKKEIEWADEHNWSIDRFFYVKKRVIAGINSVLMKRKQQPIILMLKKQKSTAEERSLIMEIDASIAKAERPVLLEGLTIAEFEMIESEVDSIMKVMGY